MTKFYVNFPVGDFFRTFAIKNKHTDMRLRNIMFAGTGSDVGKSVIAAAFCRIFRQDGYHPAPFKAQNMALNSYATPDGLEIGRAQAAQAEAACIDCHVDMNPVLLKPQSDHTSIHIRSLSPGNHTLQLRLAGMPSTTSSFTIAAMPTLMAYIETILFIASLLFVIARRMVIDLKRHEKY